MSFRTVASLAALAVALAAADAAAGQDMIDVRLNGAFAPAVVDAIARLGQPTRMRVPPNSQFRRIVTSRCGSVDPAYVLAFLRENPSLAASDLDVPIGGAEYVFPACARSPDLARVLAPNQTIGELFRIRRVPVDGQAIDAYRGVAAAAESPAPPPFACLRPDAEAADQGAPAPACDLRSFAAAENTRRFLEANPGIDARRLIPGRTELNLPEDSGWTTIILREGVGAEQARQELEAAAQSAGRSAVETDSVSVASLVASDPIVPGSCVAATDDWPFALDSLEQALATNNAVRPQNAEPRLASILVLDTGLENAFLGRAIPAEYLGKAAAPGVSSGAIRYSGVNLATSQLDAVPPSSLANRLHGSEVASTMIGGSLLEPRRADLTIPVRMIFASLATTSEERTILSNRAIVESLRYARRNRIPIINGSVYASENRQEFLDALDNSEHEVLFITAAGNNSQPFDSPGGLTWPGAFGGDPQNAGGSLVVTVGSHDATGKISSFSRRGRTRVDLLAPGCEIPTFSIVDGKADDQVTTVTRSGTSFAAPIVSLVAGYMFAEGVNPPDIKARLLTSVDVDFGLYGLVYSSGRLNVRKALSVWQDYLEYVVRPPDAPAETRSVVGRLEFPNRALTACDQAMTQADLRKLSIPANRPNSQIPRELLVWGSIAGNDPFVMYRERCDISRLEGEDIVIREAGTDALVRVPLGDVIDFVARSL